MNNGSIKKIDELGRIVIPKDIRKRLSIKKDDSLEISIDDNYIKLVKAVAIKNYDEYVIGLLKMLVDNMHVKILATNREKVIFNNTEITDLDVKRLVGLSLYDLMREKDKICSACDLRPVIIDSNVEGIILVSDSSCNEIVGQILNILMTNKLDISC